MIIVYGASLKGRSNHWMANFMDDRIMIYGGKDDKSFCETT